MCGIYGRLAPGGAPLIALEAIRRRGPDDFGIWSDPKVDVWLGHRRLAIIDITAAGHQPMLSPDDRIVMVYNGEIYNYPELRADLEAQGETFTGHSDSEVLLRLFARDGADCFSRLNGIFAAAFWDRSSGKLTLVRDRSGVKPLYYAESGGIAFASEMKALLRAGDALPELDPQAVLHHLAFLWSPGAGTIVKAIRKLLPGHVLEFSSGAASKIWRFADTAPSVPKPRPDPVDDTAIRVAAAVELAVSRQLLSDVPLGAFLSGGLDSSAIAAFAQRQLGSTPLPCFTIELTEGGTVAEGFADDLPYARRVAKHIGADLHVVRVDDTIIDRLDEMIYFLDEPTPDPAALNTLAIAELANAHGMKVLLSGAGGDDIFTGYRRHYALMQERWWGWLPQSARATVGRMAAFMPQRPALTRRIGKAFANAGLDGDRRLASYFLWLQPPQALALLSPDFRAKLDTPDVLAPLLGTLGELADGVEPLEAMLHLERQHFLCDHNLNYTDKMGMAAGVEVRVPLLDPDLVSLANGLPVDYKQRGRTGKWIFKRAMEPYLPRDVIYRPKSGFGVPLRRWLKGPLRELVEEVLAPKSLSARGIFDPAAVRRLVDQDRAGTIDATYPLFAVICIELWCRQFSDGCYAVDRSLMPAGQ